MSAYQNAHLNPSGPNDSRPTASQIIQDQNLSNQLRSKVILITGSSSGIGAETARALSQTGARLFLAVRNVEKARHVLSDILTQHSERMHLLEMDLASLSSIRGAVQEFLNNNNKLNVLICNGGVMGTPPTETSQESTTPENAPKGGGGRTETEDGIETHFATNHVGHFLLFQLLKPVLMASVTEDFHSRVIGVTSSGHRKCGVRFEDMDLRELENQGGYTSRLAYAQSKTANILMMNEIERRYGHLGLHGLSVHPGGIFTGLQKYLSPEVMEQLRKPEIMRYMKSPEQGAATTVVAAVGREWEGRGGKYLEDCAEGRPVSDKGYKNIDPGYEEFAFDRESAERLWHVSLRLVGLDDK